MYPCKYKSSLKIKKYISSTLNIINYIFDKFNDIISGIFSPTKLYMKGLITLEEYNSFSKYNVVKLRIYHTSSTPLILKVIFRKIYKNLFGFLRKVLID